MTHFVYDTPTHPYVPVWVKEKLAEIAKSHEIEHSPVLFKQIKGTIDSPFIDISKQVNIWVSSDNESFYVYLGGSGCWIHLSNEFVFFEGIDPMNLTKIPIRSEWYIIKVDLTNEQLSLYEVTIVSEDDMAGHEFPNL